jgi:aminoglycoside phosphotransferase (APT) family kinase protein
MQAHAVPGIDLPALERFLDAPLQAELVAGGRSNLTYRLRSGPHTWILRRPPLALRLATAHDMAREYTVLSALADSHVPVPRPLALCKDEAVIGAPFYVMEYVEGRILRRPQDVDLTAKEARCCSEVLVDTLAALHGLDYEAIGLGSFGRPAGFMERQLRRWHEQLQKGRARPLEALDELGRRLRAALPAGGGAAIVHGDYRIDNVVLDAHDAGRIAAVLDWEMATLGDPLADLGMLLMYWGRPGETFASEMHAVMAAPGFYERDEVVARYVRATGAELDDLGFYVAFAHFKLAVIVEGIHARTLAGKTVGDGFERIGEIAPVLAAAGLEGLA